MLLGSGQVLHRVYYVRTPYALFYIEVPLKLSKCRLRATQPGCLVPGVSRAPVWGPKFSTVALARGGPLGSDGTTTLLHQDIFLPSVSRVPRGNIDTSSVPTMSGHSQAPSPPVSGLQPNWHSTRPILEHGRSQLRLHCLHCIMHSVGLLLSVQILRGSLT